MSKPAEPPAGDPAVDHDGREEHDLLGVRMVPEHALYGIHTLRSMENFPISAVQIGAVPELVEALACVKAAAATANRELGLLDAVRADAILEACREVREGKWHHHFVVDLIQGGAGTSTNMNANEVIANRGLEILGHPRGAYEHLHPLDHVNMSQSTNDVYPTALGIALTFLIRELLTSMAHLRERFEEKEREFAGILKMGRTQLQDAVPMTLGQEFSAFAVSLGEDEKRLREAQSLLAEINLGATAIGTGINTHPAYASLACGHLAEITGLPLVTSPNLVEATPDTGHYVQLSGVLKRVAVKLSKTCNDLRLLSSGPRAGFNEINLPAVQAGSSIMPGKVNPVIPEVVNQVAFEVIGGDVTITMAAEAGQLQLNAFEPIIALALFRSLTHLRSAIDVLAERCVVGITANAEWTGYQVETSPSLVTALSPAIGYERATAIAREAMAGRGTVRELVLEHGWLTEAEIDEMLAPDALTQPFRRKPR